MISSGSRFETVIGYSRAVVDGPWCFVSGTTGFDYAAMTISDSVVEQAGQCFENIIAALAQGYAGVHNPDSDVEKLRDLVTYLSNVTDRLSEIRRR